jgi:hypothetical protein
MDIKLKITEDCFEKINNNLIKYIRHGFSKNKKYTRLFENKIESILLISDKTGREINKKFDSVRTFDNSGKKFIEISFK